MKEWIKSIPLLNQGYRTLRGFFESHTIKSYSQEGEDLVLKRIFEHQKNGFYVDIGAHHPLRFSNTYLFYKKGWSGINIDAMPHSMKSFNRMRPRDINIESPIGEDNQELCYHIFNESALNTFKSDLAKKILQIPHYKLLKTQVLKTRSLKSILDEFLPKSQKIDFMSIDVEGLDLQVLQSNDWGEYRPKILLVEILGGGDIQSILSSPTYAFLSNQGYGFFAKTFNTCFFKIKEFQ